MRETIKGMLCMAFVAQSILVVGQSIRFSEIYDHPNGGAGILEGVVTTDEGNLLLIGNSLNFSTGLRDAHHLVVNNAGLFLTEVSLETDSFEINPQAIVKSVYGGGYYSSGYWCNYVNPGVGPCDFYISRLNGLGDTLFTSIIERPDTSDILLSMVETRPNKIMLIGWTYDDTTNTDADLLFITVDTLGNELNRVVYGGGGTDYVHSGLRIDQDGHVLMVGYTKSYPSINSGRSWVVKTDSIGNVLWHRTYSGIGGPSASGIGLDMLPDENIIISGGRSGNGYLQKIDTAGSQIWIKEYDVDGGQGLWSCKTLVDGSILASGVTDADDGSQAGWLIKTDANGDTLWTRTYNSSGNTDFLRNMLVMPNGDIVMVGFGRGENSTTQDGWILRVDSMGCLEEGCWTVGIDDRTIDDERLAIFPNPASDVVRFKVQSSKFNVAFIQAVDVLGRDCFSRSSFAMTDPLDVSGWPDGIYMITVTDEDGNRYAERLVVQH